MAPNGATRSRSPLKRLSAPSQAISLAPVHVLVRLPHVRTAAAEAEGPEAHRLQRDVAGEDDQVGPGDLLAVLLLDRPEQAARLVDVDVVGPAVERGEALLAAAAAAAAVGDAVGPGGVPGHADELRPVVAEVRRPPVLRVGHQLDQVLLQRLVVEALEFLRVVEARCPSGRTSRNAGAAAPAAAGSATSRGSSCRRRRCAGTCPRSRRQPLCPCLSPIKSHSTTVIQTAL